MTDRRALLFRTAKGAQEKAMSNDSMGRRIQAVRQLLEMFRMERTIYVVVNCLSLLLLLAVAVLLFSRNELDKILAFGLFGSGGLITFSTGKLLKMWSDALRLLGAPEPGAGE
jgi:hypothetical protein